MWIALDGLGVERDGLVQRTVYPTIPARVEYQLTPLGKTLLKTARELAGWAQANAPQILEARAEFDRRESAAPRPVAHPTVA